MVDMMVDMTDAGLYQPVILEVFGGGPGLAMDLLWLIIMLIIPAEKVL